MTRHYQCDRCERMGTNSNHYRKVETGTPGSSHTSKVGHLCIDCKNEIFA